MERTRRPPGARGRCSRTFTTLVTAAERFALGGGRGGPRQMEHISEKLDGTDVRVRGWRGTDVRQEGCWSTVPHEYDGEMMMGCCRQHSSPSSPFSSSSSSRNRPLSSTLKSAHATTSPSCRAAYCTQRAGLLPLTPPSPDSHTDVQSGLPEQIWTRLNPPFYACTAQAKSPLKSCLDVPVTAPPATTPLNTNNNTEQQQH